MNTITVDLHTSPAARTVLATALTTCTAGSLPDPRDCADHLLRDLVLIPAIGGLRTDRLALIAALQDHLPQSAGHPVWLADAIADEIHVDGWAARARVQSLLLWVAA